MCPHSDVNQNIKKEERGAAVVKVVEVLLIKNSAFLLLFDGLLV